MKLKNAGTEVSDFYPTAFAFLKLTGSALPAISETFKGKASVALWDTDGESVTFIRLNDSTSLQSLSTQIVQADSAVLILSQLRNSTSTGSILNDSLPMRAYPNPWQGDSPLCFAGLPQDEHYIEVWTRSLKLAFRKSYTETSLCLEAASVRQSLAPGLYHFRAGNHGKTKPFLVIYLMGNSLKQSSIGATLTLHGFDALRHRLHFGHTQTSLSATLNLGDFSRFCAPALVGATRQCACKHARNTRFNNHSRLLPLISQVHL